MTDQVTLAASYASQDEIPEAFRPLYTEKDGKFNINPITGLVGQENVTKLTKSLEAERNAHGSMKQKWGAFFGDKKPEDIQAMLDKYPELEAAAAGKLDDDKINAIVEGRVKTKLTPVERERDTLKTSLLEAQAKLDKAEQREKTRTIHDAVRAAATKAKVTDTAIDDVLMLAERMFDVDEDGNVTAKETGILPDVWLTEMQSKRPHWWPASKGGGAGGGGGGGGGPNPFTAENWNLGEQGKVYRENPTKAAQLAAAAGTTVGGRKPAPRKAA